MNRDQSYKFHSDQDSVEQAIRAAGNFVCPTSDLRPRVVEAAKEHCGQRRARRHVARLLLFLGVFIAVAVPAGLRLSEQWKQAQSPSSEAIQKEATMYAAQSGIGANWGLSEAFSRLRESQSQRFPASSATKRK